MDTVHCRLIFRNYLDKQIETFLQDCKNYKFLYLSNFTVGPIAHFGKNLNDAFDERHETQFSFNKKSCAELDCKNDNKHLPIVLAESELVKTFEEFQRLLKIQGLAEDAAVAYTPLSKNIYPKFFKLQRFFMVNKLVLGNIVHKRYFAPTFFFDEPEGAYEQKVFDRYLFEQHDMTSANVNMLMICENDRDCLSLCFPDILPKNMKMTEYRSKDRVIEIKIPYSAIRRLIVTPKNIKNLINVTFTFQLNYPPAIYIHEKSCQPFGKKKLYFRPPSRYLTWNKSLNLEKTIEHASCIVVETRDVDARSLLDCLDRFHKTITYATEYRFLDRLLSCNIKKYQQNFFMNQDVLPQKHKKYTERKYFPLVYAIQAIISRNGAIYDYFFRPQFDTFDNFLELVTEKFENDIVNDPDAKVAKTVIVLEHMLQQIDRLHDTPEPNYMFKRLYDAQYRVIAEVTTELDKKGYMRIRKVVVTPTRKIYLNPELTMGNRCLREKGVDEMLRVVFRDDNGMKVSGLPQFFIEKTVHETLSCPMDVGFRKFSYLCSSNSQLCDHGCYFLAGTAKEVQTFRETLGSFKIEAIPKMMSRIAQCFTQARQLGILIKREDYSEIFDYTGGQDSNGKAYTFSDGCGIVSREFCEKIVQDLKLGDCLPSCYQIRFRGYKGIIIMNSFMDRVREWAEKNNRNLLKNKGSELPWFCQSFMFRSSQKKFNGPHQNFLEIVKISTPMAVSLNKPLINILDQVSEMHGKSSHERMCNRVFELLENDIDKAISTLIDEPHAFLALNEFPKYIFYNRLKDFQITEEPFFRSILRSSALVGLYQLVEKLQIRIPTSQGRMMFGVVDETGLLQYGQVFFQYTTNASIKYPGRHADKIVHTGPVMVTKNPSVVAGDVRMFEAVDLPCLRDLVDVIVFPQHGPRPHPDEMAGSDLDGDEYSIFWDPLLFLDRNEPAFDFTAPPSVRPSQNDDAVRAKLTESMIAFFTSYVSQDSIGAIANSHLANSDLYGINSELSHNIALKYNQAVDFPKTGQVRLPLSKSWTNGSVPPEKVERYPNFMAKSNQASYKSARLLGDLYNRVIEIREIIKTEDLLSAHDVIKLDESVLFDGDEEYIDVAESEYREYCNLIGGLLEIYGIANEGQLFSGQFNALKNRLSEKENDNFDMYNTQHMTEEQLAEIYSRFREQFFQEFCVIEECTKFDEFKSNGTRETFNRVCNNPTSQMQKKASAYYRVAYRNGQHLSFGWLASDILAYNRKQKKQNLFQPENCKLSLYPLHDRLRQYINSTCNSSEFKSRFDEFSKNIKKEISDGQSNDIISLDSANLCNYFIGLRKILFFLRLWAETHKLSILPECLDALFIKFGLGDFQNGNGGWLTVVENAGEQQIVNVELFLGGIGKTFWDFIRFITTRQFCNMKNVLLTPFTERTLDKTDYHSLYYAALDTFYSIAFNRRFENLPGGSKENEEKFFDKVSEGRTFLIEISRATEAENYSKLCVALAKKCGLSYLVLRRWPDRVNEKSFRVAVKPVGTFLNVRKFRSLLEVSPSMTETNLEKRSTLIAKETYKKLLFYTREENSVDDVFVS